MPNLDQVNGTITKLCEAIEKVDEWELELKVACWRFQPRRRRTQLDLFYETCGFHHRLAFTDKKSYQFMASQMVGIPESEYVKMMLSGGRSPDGWRSKSERSK